MTTYAIGLATAVYAFAAMICLYRITRGHAWGKEGAEGLADLFWTVVSLAWPLVLVVWILGRVARLAMLIASWLP